MWLSIIEKGESLAAIYGSDVPSLENVQLHELSILPGYDPVIRVRLDIRQLPAQLPKKWMDRQVNCVQISLCMVAATIIFFNVQNPVSNITNIFIEQTEERRLVVKMRDKMQNDIMVVNADFINLISINGYSNSIDDPS